MIHLSRSVSFEVRTEYDVNGLSRKILFDSSIFYGFVSAIRMMIFFEKTIL